MNTVANETKSSFLLNNKSGVDVKGKMYCWNYSDCCFINYCNTFRHIGVSLFTKEEKSFSWEFISSFPTDGMTKGGIFPALIGTFILVVVMSIAAVPFGTITSRLFNRIC